jgi:hypothetical protein
MSIVIDTNTIVAVFDPANTNYQEFASIRKWIESKQGILVFGGTKYKTELGRVGRTQRIVRLMRDAGLAVSICDRTVDEIQNDIEQKTRGTECDDQHIIALLAASWCTLLCSQDKRSFPFVKDRQLYPRGMPAVKIFSSSRNSSILLRHQSQRIRNIRNLESINPSVGES